MTKLEELKAALDAAYAAAAAAWYEDAHADVWYAARNAYEAELKKTKEKQND